MKFWHSLMRGTVVLLLIFVFGVGFLEPGDVHARMELTREMNNTDGDPGEGSDSSGSGSGSSDYVPPPEDDSQVWNPLLPFFVWSSRMGTYFYSPCSQFYSIIVLPSVDFKQTGRQQ